MLAPSQYSVSKYPTSSIPNWCSPIQLHQRLGVSPHLDMQMDEKRVSQYRRMLYSINSQGKFRYRTARIPHGLRVWRLK